MAVPRCVAHGVLLARQSKLHHDRSVAPTPKPGVPVLASNVANAKRVAWDEKDVKSALTAHESAARSIVLMFREERPGERQMARFGLWLDWPSHKIRINPQRARPPHFALWRLVMQRARLGNSHSGTRPVFFFLPSTWQDVNLRRAPLSTTPAEEVTPC